MMSEWSDDGEGGWDSWISELVEPEYIDTLGIDTTSFYTHKPSGLPSYEDNFEGDGRGDNGTVSNKSGGNYTDNNQSSAETDRLTRFSKKESGLGNITNGFDTPNIDPNDPSYFSKLGDSIKDWILKNPNKSIEGLLTTLGGWYEGDQAKQASDAKGRNAIDLANINNQANVDLVKLKSQMEIDKLNEQRRFNSDSVTALPNQGGIIQSALKRTNGTDVFNAQNQFVRG